MGVPCRPRTKASPSEIGAGPVVVAGAVGAVGAEGAIVVGV